MSLSATTLRGGSSTHTMMACNFNSRGPWPLEFSGGENIG